MVVPKPTFLKISTNSFSPQDLLVAISLIAYDPDNIVGYTGMNIVNKGIDQILWDLNGDGNYSNLLVERCLLKSISI